MNKNNILFYEHCTPKEWNLVHRKNPNAHRLGQVPENGEYVVGTIVSVFPESIHQLTNKNVANKLTHELSMDTFFIWYEPIRQLSKENQLRVIRHCQPVIILLLLESFRETYMIPTFHQLIHTVVTHLLHQETPGSVFASILEQLLSRLGTTKLKMVEQTRRFAIELANKIRDVYSKDESIQNLSQFIFTVTRDLFLLLKNKLDLFGCNSIHVFELFNTITDHLNVLDKDHVDAPVLRYIQQQFNSYIEAFSLKHCACCKRKCDDNVSLCTRCCEGIRYCDEECKTDHQRIHDLICKPEKGSCLYCKQTNVLVKTCLECNQTYCSKTCLETHPVHVLTCHDCQAIRPSTDLFKCQRCSQAIYCNRDCQRNHWRNGGHREACLVNE